MESIPLYAIGTIQGGLHANIAKGYFSFWEKLTDISKKADILKKITSCQ